jgi:cytochrome c
MNSTRLLTFGCLAAFSASLLLARVHPFGDAGLDRSQQITSSLLDSPDVPSTVRQTLVTKCADCHSTQTRRPLYSHLAPFSWLMERDIVNARAAMNLSNWDHYPVEERESFKVKALLETRSGHNIV